jgi:hypothetical protein
VGKAVVLLHGERWNIFRCTQQESAVVLVNLHCTIGANAARRLPDKLTESAYVNIIQVLPPAIVLAKEIPDIPRFALHWQADTLRFGLTQ